MMFSGTETGTAHRRYTVAFPAGSEAQRPIREAHPAVDESQPCRHDRLGSAAGHCPGGRRNPGRRLRWREDCAETRYFGAEGRVIGLDYSAASVVVSRHTNAQDIETGRVQIQQGSVAKLPFADSTFDIVTAVETHYYWPDLSANVREIRRVLKPGGTFTLIAETYRGGPFRLIYAIVMPLLRAAFLSDAEHRDLLRQAGFTEVTTKHIARKNWICATGRRPQ